MLFSRQLDQELRELDRKETDLGNQFDEKCHELEHMCIKLRAEMNAMFKEKSTIKSQIMEISQKFKDQEFGILDELGRAEHIMSRAHLGMKTYEEQIKRIKKEIEDSEKAEEIKNQALKQKYKSEGNLLDVDNNKPKKKSKKKKIQKSKKNEDLVPKEKKINSKSPKRPKTALSTTRKINKKLKK